MRCQRMLGYSMCGGEAVAVIRRTGRMNHPRHVCDYCLKKILGSGGADVKVEYLKEKSNGH